jgi:hypothetical protein
MAYPDYLNDENGGLHAIDDSVVANPDAMVSSLPLSFLLPAG